MCDVCFLFLSFSFILLLLFSFRYFQFVDGFQKAKKGVSNGELDSSTKPGGCRY